jgi:hypothetical protein
MIKKLESLRGWMESWSDNGAYYGPVVHRTEKKRMLQVHDTAWTQSAMVRGYAALCKTKHSKNLYREYLSKSADHLASTYDEERKIWMHTGHEDERFKSLVSSALAINALLDSLPFVTDAQCNYYLKISLEHVRYYWNECLWVEDEGAYKFSETDHYSLDDNRYVVNFNSVAVEALVRLGEETKAHDIKVKSELIGEWISKRWKENVDFNKKHCDRLDANGCYISKLKKGGFSYQFTDLNRIPNDYIVIYAALSLGGYVELYSTFKKDIYLEIIKRQVEFILNMIDRKNKLFYHCIKDEGLEKKPHFIAGSGMIFVGLQKAEKILGKKILPEETVEKILNLQYKNGSFPNFIGKNDTGKPRRNLGGEVWEDVASTPNWCAQMFEFLASNVHRSELKNIEKIQDQWLNYRLTKRFVYIDSKSIYFIASWFPLRSIGLYFYYKKFKYAILCFDLIGTYSFIRRISMQFKSK